MYDFIEALILRDQAEEELLYEAVDDKLKHEDKLAQERVERDQKKHSKEVHVYIDDKDHKYYFKPH